MFRLLIADAAEDFSLALSDALQDNYRIRRCRSGKEALNLLLREKIDIMILDLMLPELDGISLLHRVVDAGEYPMVLATTPLVNDYILQAADELGIGYLMVKPCEIRAVTERIRDLHRRIHRPVSALESSRMFISQQLLDFGFSTKLRGFDYLKEAIFLMSETPGQAVTKELYPAVGVICNTTAAHVERSIRNAIAAAWSHKNEQAWQRFFSASTQRPSNGAFITRLAEHVVWSKLEDPHA